MSKEQELVELASFALGGVTIGSGLLGATGATAAQAASNRLLEIERRILAIEGTLRTLSQDRRGTPNDR